MDLKKMKKTIFTILIAVVILIGLIAAITIVPAGHTGVRVMAGEVRGTAPEGLTFVVPFVEHIQIMNNRTVAMEMNTEAVTRDLQAVRMNYIVNYQLNPDASAHVFRTIGIAYESIVLRPIVEETLKDITARYAIEELITERARVSADITSALQVAFIERGFTLERFNIVDFHFSEQFSNAIEQVRIAEQNALRAEQDLARVHHEAEADRERARAQSDVLRYQAQELTETNLAAMWIERWNGVVPIFVSGDSQGIMINLDDLTSLASQPAQTQDGNQQRVQELMNENARLQRNLDSLAEQLEAIGLNVNLD